MKRILACFVTLMMVLGFSGCGQAFQMDKITDLKEIPFGASFKEMKAQAERIPSFVDSGFPSFTEKDGVHAYKTTMITVLGGEFLGLPADLDYHFMEDTLVAVDFYYYNPNGIAENSFEDFKMKLQEYGGGSPEEYIFDDYERMLIWDTKDYHIELTLLISTVEQGRITLYGNVVNLDLLHEVGTYAFKESVSEPR